MGERKTNWLNGEQQAQFMNALMEAFAPDSLMILLGKRLNRPLFIAGGLISREEYRRVLWQIVDDANNNEWAAKLLGAALAENPESRPLLAFARSMGVGSSATVDDNALEKAIRSSSILQDIGAFIEKLVMIERAVCQVAVPGGGGTGTLVGRDLVLTNHHVIADLSKTPGGGEGVTCHFDFRRAPDGREVHPPKTVRLASHWHVDSGPHSERDIDPELGDPEPDRLDYALLRLETNIGEQPVDESVTQLAPRTTRGWVHLETAEAPPVAGAPLFIVEHPQKPGQPDQEPMQLCIGVVLPGSPLNRLWHDATTHPGASGALCFNDSLNPVALHHLGDPNHHESPKYNQAIPVQAIWLACKTHVK